MRSYFSERPKEIIDSESLDGTNFFIEPAVGAKIRIHKKLALNINVGYDFDLTKRFRNKGQSLTIAPDGVVCAFREVLSIISH